MVRNDDARGLEGLSGLTWKSMKKYPAILPMYALMFIGVCISGGYVFRLATKHPEVTWSRKGNPEPWQEYSNKQYKFLDSGRDYSKSTPAPKYR